MNSTMTVVVDAFLATLEELHDADLRTLLISQLAPTDDETFCFVTIDRDHEVFTLAIDGAWVTLALGVHRDRTQVDVDMELPRGALRAVVRGRCVDDNRRIGATPSITMSADGIPHISFESATA